MKNLTVTDYASYSLENICDKLPDTLHESKTFCCIDPNTDDLFILTKDGLFTIPSNRKSANTFTKIAKCVGVVALEFSAVTQQLLCAYDCGDIMTVNVAPPFESETVATINGGLRCMTLSPDHEILTLVTANGIVITMVSTFEVISEVNLHLSDFGRKQFVTVGWGKKETQFHGSEGKTAAKAVKSIDLNKTEYDDGLPRVTWRGDGSFFAVSFVHDKSKTRQLKVFDRSGILQYTSEPINGLEESLCWKPSGSIIATSQRTINKHVIALFEKNGLKHRVFSLPFKANEIKIEEFFWSPDSDVLAIRYRNMENDQTTIQMWTETNCHWYLKRTISFAKEDPLLYATWSADASSGKKLILLTSKKLVTFSLCWTVAGTRGKTECDKSVVCVVDGCKASLTSFRSGIVPPPMKHLELDVKEQINEVAFAPDVKGESRINSNAFFCVLESKKLAFFKHKTDMSILKYECTTSPIIESDSAVSEITLHTMLHFLWLKENVILCSVNVNGQSNLCVLDIEGLETIENCRVILRKVYPVDGIIQRIISCPDSEEAYIIGMNEIFIYEHDNASISSTNIRLQELCRQIEVVRTDTKRIVVSLSHTHRLSLDGKEVANNITSFYVHSEFLLLTTLQHSLICIPLTDDGIEQLIKEDLAVIPWKDEIDRKSYADLSIRRIERGSLIITAIPKDSRVILQMPRGNLECIQPRALSLYIVGRYLDDRNYSTAFDLMRKQRINLNLIYDHNPSLFEKNAEKFVEDIKEPSWLSLFLSELNSEDVTKTTYASCYMNKIPKVIDQNAENVEGKNKVERVCALLRDIMEKRPDGDRFVQPILISYVKNREREGLEAALRKIREIKKSEESQGYMESLGAEGALKYLLYLVDINTLFETALGMYDFDLTMFIASKSQKDPKEYLPFLNSLKRSNENYMKYRIDLHLKRYESALVHVSKESDRFNECTNLIRNHGLYKEGLMLFDRGSNEYKEIATMYGDDLLSKCKYREAGIVFQKSGDLESALNAYKRAGCWQDAIITAMEMKLSTTESQLLYKELVARLQQDKRHKEAADILMNYLNDPEKAIVSLCTCNEWKTALRIACTVQRLDLIDTCIKRSVLEHADYVVNQIDRNKEDFEKHKTRLALIRSEWHTRKQSFFDNGIYDKLTPGKEVSDFLSDTSSTIVSSTDSQKSRTSTLSGRSYRSSKNRRKQERKLLSLKEGSVFEDLGLIRALYEIVMNVYKYADELNLLMEMLIYFDNEECVRKIRVSISEFLRTIEIDKKEIWDRSAPSSLAETENLLNANNSVQTLLQEVQKLIEPRMMHPPETVSYVWLDVL